MTTDKPTVDQTATIESMSARIAELEAANKKLITTVPVSAPQAIDAIRKNNTKPLTQITRAGNVRTTVDPSQEFVLESGLTGTITDTEDKEIQS